MNVLIVVAHPDDEILGCGGVICKHIDNRDDVYIIVATQPTEEYSLEYKQEKLNAQEKIDKSLGIKSRICLGYPTVSLNTIPFGEFNKKLNNLVNVIQPNIIYTHFKGDLNQDHKIVYEACLVATRPPKTIQLVCFETISETEWGDEGFKPNYYVNIGQYLDKKVEAFECYTTEIKKIPHPRNASGISHLAKQRGFESGYFYAEAFKIVRWYSD